MWSGFSREATPATTMVHAASAFQMNQGCSLTALQMRIGGGGGEERRRGNGKRGSERERGFLHFSPFPRLVSPHMEACSALSDTEVEVKDRLSAKLWDWSGNRSRKPQASRVGNMAARAVIMLTTGGQICCLTVDMYIYVHGVHCTYVNVSSAVYRLLV